MPLLETRAGEGGGGVFVQGQELIIVLVDATGGLHARRMWVFTPSACPPWWLPAKPPPPQRWGGPHAWTLVTT